MADDAAISARGLTKRFGAVLALDAVDLRVARGARLGIIGRPGAGKSTLVRLLVGLVHSTAGSLSIAGADAGSVAARRRIGAVLEGSALQDWMTAREALTFGATLAGLPSTELPGRVERVAERLDLGRDLDRRVSALGVPVRGRLALAQALVADPEILLLDEPFESLDPESRELAIQTLGGVPPTTTILLATQRVPDAERLCDRVAVLDDGRLLREGPVGELLGDRVGRTYEVDVVSGTGIAMAGLVARLRTEPWVAATSVVGGRLRVTVSDTLRAQRELLPALVATGLPITALTRASPSIDEIVGRLGGRPPIERAS